MKNHVLNIILVIASVGLFACKSTKKAAATNTAETKATSTESSTSNTEQQQQGKLLFSYERTACFGQCPVYEINVYDNGYMTYNGKYHTEFIGMHYSNISQDNINRVMDLAKQIGFMDYKDEYQSLVTDLPSRITTIVLDGKVKKVKDHGGDDAPEQLRDLEGLIENITKDIAWKAKQN